ncbi:trypsin-like peptidase domain-containing protein [Myxococcus sp. RHSTA-1-4]|uniref:trypsin-like peptidase domain-containing protein n=1 Tax=Myxococcus sp. RHSTA-1-4 TaxID=2874601 RepID=UPI001CBFB8C6|nr:trypsin-like peptidase domain-containing protein [Myxococcus sp. RHSTA-1-4]MBZ4416090.1 trypsin-like peptidase domain-containing protein [Myxococcus sp. RHSTA-1-4]
MKRSTRLRTASLGLLLALAGCRRESEQPPPAPPPAAPDTPAGERRLPSGQVMPPDMGAALASVAPLVDSVRAAVVQVEVRAASPARRSRGDSPWGEEEESPFGGPWGPFTPFGPREEPPRQGLGSGFITDARGLVLTNHHVVKDATDIQVRLPDGRELSAKVLGTDPLTDVALLQLRLPPGAKALPVVRLGDADALRVGDWVVAIGNPFGLSSSVSLGILSAKARDIGAGPFDDFLQTDAAINPGNSGGPLFNLRGEVVGINTAIVGQGSGIGFAVPSNLVRALLPQLEEEGAVTRGWLGVAVQDLTADLGEALGLPTREGAVVTDVSEDTPAAAAGLRPDDVIIAVDGQPIASGGALTRAVALKAPGTALTLSVYRDGKREEVKATLGTRPDLEGVASRGRPGAEEMPPDQRVGLVISDMDARLAQAQGLPGSGALVTDVDAGSVAERAGLAPGMVVVEARGQPVRRARDLVRALREAEPGEPVLLRVVSPGGQRALRALTVPAE